MDPFSQVIALLKPQAVFWRVVEAHGDWTIRFLPTDVVVFGQLIEGSARVERDDRPAFDAGPGDFLLMAAPPPWSMTGGRGGTPVDFKEVIESPDLLTTGPAARVTRFIAGNFKFASANSDLVAGLMLPIVHVRAGDPAVARLSSILTAVGNEAMNDRPGRSLVLDRLLEILLVEALRYRSDTLTATGQGFLAGLTDPKIGKALRLMHEAAQHPWTVATLASAVGMSRSAFAARFVTLMHMPPIDYLARWRLTLAKAALASSKLPMMEIAEIAGYKSVSAFSTGFKRATGLSPKRFAQSQTQDVHSFDPNP